MTEKAITLSIRVSLIITRHLMLKIRPCFFAVLLTTPFALWFLPSHGQNTEVKTKRDLDVFDTLEKKQLSELIDHAEILLIASAVETTVLGPNDHDDIQVPPNFANLLEPIVSRLFVIAVLKGEIDAEWIELIHFGVKESAPSFGGKAPIIFEFNSEVRTAQLQFDSGERGTRDFKNFYLLGVERLPSGKFGLALDPSRMNASVRLLQWP